ncbi:hypothetical protein COCCADRAFT_82091, partial [Bipolaris zeicola 26-R-13]
GPDPAKHAYGPSDRGTRRSQSLAPASSTCCCQHAKDDPGACAGPSLTAVPCYRV